MTNQQELKNGRAAIWKVCQIKTENEHFKIKRKHLSMEIIGYDNHIPELHKVNRFSMIEINTRSMAAAVVRMLTNPRDYPCKTLLIPPHLIK